MKKVNELQNHEVPNFVQAVVLEGSVYDNW